MRTYYLFQSGSAPDLRGFADTASGGQLPPEYGPWTLLQQIAPDQSWTLGISRAVVAGAILENGFYLWGTAERPHSPKPVIESDRVEGTAVYDRDGGQVGTIKRLLIEKVSGRVLYVDVTFGGFLGIGVHHRTIPWGKLSYVRDLEGYRTDITKEQVQGAPSFCIEGDDEVWPDRKRQQEMREYWHNYPRGPI